MHSSFPVDRAVSRRRSASHPAALSVALVAAAIGFGSSEAHAAPFYLNFEGIAKTTIWSLDPQIREFYNGGFSSDGTQGFNYGVSFGSNALAICLTSTTDQCRTKDSQAFSNTSRGGLGDPGSRRGALFWLSGSQTYLNVSAGFDTGFSFYYAAAFQGGSISVFDGPNATGKVLATLALPINASGKTGTVGPVCPGYQADFCPFTPVGVSFSGVAFSVGFGGAANQIVFDDMTFGSTIPGPDIKAVPLPASIGLLGLGIVGLGIARRRKNG